jgi:hypothetical protein
LKPWLLPQQGQEVWWRLLQQHLVVPCSEAHQVLQH